MRKLGKLFLLAKARSALVVPKTMKIINTKIIPWPIISESLPCPHLWDSIYGRLLPSGFFLVWFLLVVFAVEVVVKNGIFFYVSLSVLGCLSLSSYAVSKAVE